MSLMYSFMMYDFWVVKKLRNKNGCHKTISVASKFKLLSYSIRNYLSSVTSEKSASCESCAMNVMNASCANNAHLHPFVHSKAAPGSVIVPAQ